MMNMKVRNMLSTRTGRPVPNQFEVRIGDTYYFQSYRSVVAMYDTNTNMLIIGKNWNYSITTKKYLYQFMDEHNITLPDGKTHSDAIKKGISSGKIYYDENLD